MTTPWRTTKFPGVRYYEHPERKHGARPDRYYAIRYQAAGTRREYGLGWASQGWSDVRAAVELAERKEAAKIRKDRGPAPESPQGPVRRDRTFGELMAGYLDWAREHKRHWAQDAERYHIHLAGHLESVLLVDVTPAVLETIKEVLLRKGLAPATVRHCLALVRQVFNKAVLWGLHAGPNPLFGVRLPSPGAAKERVLEHAEEQRLMPLLRRKSVPAWAMAMLALYGGLRFGEAARLRGRDLDFEQGLIRVEDAAGRGRTIPMNRTLRDVLLECRPPALLPSGLLFPGRNGRPPRKISRSWQRAVVEAGLNAGEKTRHRRLDFQALRHTWATRLGALGTAPDTLRRMGGWADFQLVGRYCRSGPDQAEAAARGLDFTSEDQKVQSFIRESETYRLQGSAPPDKPRRLSRLQDQNKKTRPGRS